MYEDFLPLRTDLGGRFWLPILLLLAGLVLACSGGGNPAASDQQTTQPMQSNAPAASPTPAPRNTTLNLNGLDVSEEAYRSLAASAQTGRPLVAAGLPGTIGFKCETLKTGGAAFAVTRGGDPLFALGADAIPGATAKPGQAPNPEHVTRAIQIFVEECRKAGNTT